MASRRRLAGALACAVLMLGPAKAEGPPLDCRPETQPTRPAPQAASGQPSGESKTLASAAEHSATPAAAKAATISGPREMLALRGLPTGRLDALTDGTPLGGDQLETLWRALMALHRFSLVDIHRWKQRQLDWDRLTAEPASHRGEIVELAGRVRSVTREVPPEGQADQFDLREYYRCELLVGAPELPATVYARKVPKAWTPGKGLDERVTVEGVFLKLAGEAAELARPVFAAHRVAWHPATLLGELGMDQGLFDDVRATGPLTQPVAGDREYSDRECFYQLLAAAGRTGARELAGLTGKRVYEAIPLLQHPQQHFGELLAFDGLARRATLVRVEDPDIVSRFGIDHYYELEVTVELEALLKVRDEVMHSFPMVFCVRRLPKGMPLGERINETVRVPAFFFKVWSYRSEGSLARGPEARQWAPLLVGRSPLWIANPPVQQGFSNTVFLGIFVFLLATAWIVVWRLNRGDEKFRRRVIRPTLGPRDALSLNELGLEVQGPASFDAQAD